MNDQLLNLMKKRRTIRNLGSDVSFSQDELYDYIKQIVRLTPSVFNNQTVRAVILFNESKDKLWDIVQESLEEKVPEDAFLRTKAKISMFRNSFGSILFYTDMDGIVESMKKFPTYRYEMYNWSEEAQGNAQFAVWTGLEENGLGVNIRHFDPLINGQVASAFDIPDSWQLRCEMNFGSIEKGPDEKEIMADEDRFRLIK